MPHPTARSASCERRLYRRVPAAAEGSCARASTPARELRVLGFVKNPRLMRVAERARAPPPARAGPRPRAARASSRRTTRSAASGSCPPTAGTRRSASPTSRSSTDGIARGRASARSSTADGTEREVDTIIFGTGFHVTDMPIAQRVRGRGGRDARPRRGRAARSAYLGTTIAGFPNLFMLLGPNTGLGHNSMVFMIESQIAYVLDALRAMRRARRRVARGRAGGAGGVQPRASTRGWRARSGTRRLRELVHRRHRPQHDAVARLDLALPPAQPRASTRRSTSCPEPPGRARGGTGMSARVLITGARAASAGRRPRRCARRGARVVGLDLRADDAHDVIACDVRDQAAVDARWRRRSSGSAGSTC